jgi:hypothetical protein
MVEIPTPNPYIFMIRVNRQIKCLNNLFFVLWNLMISWIVFILHRKIFPIHHTYIYSLVSYLFIKTKWFWLATRLLHLKCFLDFFFVNVTCITWTPVYSKNKNWSEGNSFHVDFTVFISLTKESIGEI